MADPVFSVRELMSNRLVTVDPEAHVSEALSIMEKNQVHELPVMSNSTLKGWLSYQDLVRRGAMPGTTKVANLMVQPPRIAKEASLIEAANLMIQNNARALPVMDSKGKVVGVLSRTDVLKAVARIPSLADTPIDAAMNAELETCDERESVDKAINRIRSANISQLLVVNGQGKLQGHVALEDLVRAHSSEHGPPKGGRASGRGATVQGGGEKTTPHVEIKSFVRESPSLTSKATLGEAAQAMASQHSNFVAIVDDGYAVGVVSRSNVVERVARLAPPPGVLCQIVGLADSVDSDVLDSIYTLAQHTLKKVSTEVTPEFLSLHYKVYKGKTGAKSGGDSKYSLSAHFSSQDKFFVQKADAWNPVDATKQAMDGLEKRVMDLKERRLEARKGPSRRKTNNFYTAANA